MTEWTYGQRLAAGFLVVVMLALCISVVAVLSLRSVVEAKDAVIAVEATNLVYAEQLRTAYEARSAVERGYLLLGDEHLLAEAAEVRSRFDETMRLLESNSAHAPELVAAIREADQGYQREIEEVRALRGRDQPIEEVAAAFEARVLPARSRLAERVDGYVAFERDELVSAREEANRTATSAIWLVIGIALVAVLAAAALAWGLTRSLGQQIGTAVGQVQSSAAELQAAANQQATGSREQATAMSEVTTTISELLATSRQIAESARRVAQIAEETRTAARAGTATLDHGGVSMAAIREQVDRIVQHMLDLGRKSQQIGAVVEIVSELAEQTNILAINATIEAAGAGESGRRFAVVADEIRKLADRVGGSTKEIRGLVDDVRASVNTTVMVTESGSKAVDAGSRAYGEVAASFERIAGLVGTAAEAAREIELSTQQQATAVEQVNVAIASVAQASRETEASSGQTLVTASQLAGLSRELLGLIRPQAAA